MGKSDKIKLNCLKVEVQHLSLAINYQVQEKRYSEYSG